MSKKLLLYSVIAVCLWFVLFALLYCYSVYYKNTEFTTAIKDMVSFIVALPAAFLAYAFNRRNSYLQALRELWKQLVPSVQKAIQYTHLSEPKQGDFALVMENLSSVIDLTRGVFSNVKLYDSRGLFPHENLKDIQLIIAWLSFGKNFREPESAKARLCITALWQEMHHAMLNEFDRDVPVTPVSKYFHSGRSVADLLIEGDLRDEDLKKGNPASHPRG